MTRNKDINYSSVIQILNLFTTNQLVNSTMVIKNSKMSVAGSVFALKYLLDIGYLELAPKQKDTRTVYYNLTDYGRNIMNAIFNL